MAIAKLVREAEAGEGAQRTLRLDVNAMRSTELPLSNNAPSCECDPCACSSAGCGTEACN